ncbi:MAG: MG2 domain-containing protein [Brevinema sp.]
MIRSLLHRFQNLSKERRFWIISALCYLSTILAVFFIFDLMVKEPHLSRSFNEIALEYKPKEVVFSVDKDFVTFSSFDAAVSEWESKLGLEFDPPVQGYLRPNGSREVTFVFESVLSNDLMISFKSNLLSLVHLKINGEPVTNSSYLLKTVHPEIGHAYRSDGSLDAPIFISATQPIRLQQLRKATKLMQGDKSLVYSLLHTLTTNFSPFLSIETNYTEYRLVSSSLKPSESYRLEIDQTIFSNEGVFSYEFQTHEKPAWVGFSSTPFVQENQTNQTFTAAKPIWLLHNNPLDTKKGSVSVKITPPVSNIQTQIDSTGISISADFEADTEYTIAVNPRRIRDMFKQKNNETYIGTVFIQNEKPQIAFAKDVLIVDKEKPLIPIQSINTTNIRIAYQLVRSDFYAALSFFGRSVPVVTMYTNITLSNITPNKYEWHYFDASTITTNQSALLNMKVYDPQGNVPSQYTKVLLTGSALSAHVSENAILFYAQRVTTQKPIENMNILVWDHVRGSFQDLGQTTADGTLYVPNPRLPDSVLEKPIFLGVDDIERDLTYAGVGDSVFQTLDQKSFYSASQLLFGNIFQSSQIKSVLFTDRDLYLPGEKVQVQVFARKRSNNKLVSSNFELFNQSVQIRVTGPNNKSITNITKNWGSFGAISTTIDLPKNAESGHYSIHVSNSATKFSAYHSFEVKPFKSQQSEILIAPQNTQYLYQQNLKAQIRPQFLFDQPIKTSVSYHLHATPIAYQSKSYPNHIFNAPEILRSLRLGQQAEFTLVNKRSRPKNNDDVLTLDHKLLPKFPYNARLTLGATASPPSLLPISNEVDYLSVYFPTQLGIKMDQRQFTMLEDISFDFIAIAPFTEELQINLPVKLEIFKFESVSLGIFSFLTNYFPNIDSYKRRVLNDNLTLGQTKYTFSPKSEGRYQVQISTKQVGFWTKSSVDFVIDTKGSYEHTLNMTANKSSYTAGERAHIEIRNPFPKSRLVLTVEQDSLREFFVVETTNKVISHFVPITSDDEPGVNITAALISLPMHYMDSEQDTFGDVVIGHLALPVDPLNKQLTVQVNNLKDNYLPREEVTFDISAFLRSLQVDGQALVIVRDRAALTGNSLPNLMQRFYQPSPAGFTTWSSSPLIYDLKNFTNKLESHRAVPLMRSLSDLEASVAESLASSDIKLRSNIVYTPYYKSEIPLYRNRKSEITFTLPDNISRFDVTVMVYDKDQLFGQTNISFSTSKPFITEPILPDFVRPDDEVSWGVYAHNLTQMPLHSSLIMTNNFSQISTNVTLKPNSSLPILMKSKIGQAKTSIWFMNGIAEQHQDGFVKTIPVINFSPWKVHSFLGLLENSKTNMVIPLDNNPDLIDQRLVVQMSTSPILLMSDLLYQTITNQSMNLHHVLNKILVVAGNEEILKKYTTFDLVDLQDYVQNSLDNIVLYSTDTAIYEFPVDTKITNSEDPMLTLKAFEALITAQQNSYRINSTLYQQLSQKILAYAQNKFSKSSERNSFYRVFAMKLLSSIKMLDQVTFDNALESLGDSFEIQVLLLETMKSQGLPTRAIALQTSKLMQQLNSRSLVMNVDKITPQAVDSLLQFFGNDINLMQTWESIVSLNADNLRNHLLFEKYFPKSPNTTLKLQIANQQTVLNSEKNSFVYDLPKNKSEIDLKLETTNDSVYYVLRYEQLFEKAFDSDDAYTVTKTIVNAENEALKDDQSLKMGETYTAVLKIKPNKVSQSWVEIIDPLFGGILVERTNNMMLSPVGDNLHIFTRLSQETTIRYRFQPKLKGHWTAPPTIVQNIQNSSIISLTPQTNITIVE